MFYCFTGQLCFSCNRLDESTFIMSCFLAPKFTLHSLQYFSCRDFIGAVCHEGPLGSQLSLFLENIFDLPLLNTLYCYHVR
jgi:hypothetical protein